MAVLRAYLDDSGNGDSPGETHLTIGGFLAESGGWEYFEPRWQAILHDAGVPYLHMKEFGDRNSSIYHHIKSDPERERAFMGAATALIRESARGSVAATVILQDFRSFNSDHALSLDPYAFAMYACLFQLRSMHPNDEIELVLDRFDNSTSRYASALKYANSDSSAEALKLDLFTHIPLQPNQSWRNILPLQAADLITWEVRKFRRERAHLELPPDIRADRLAMHHFVLAWEDENKPRDRGSFRSLRQGMIYRPLHIVADMHNLLDVQRRHPNGWGV